LNGSQVRRSFSSDDIESAVYHAAAVLYHEALPMNSNESQTLLISDAMAKAINAGHGQSENKNNQIRYAGYFLDWAETVPLLYWKEIRRTHIDAYVNFLVNKGLKRRTIRNYLEPVRTTGKRMSEDYPELRDPLGSFRLRRGLAESHRYDDQAGNDVLSIAEVLEFADWLSGQKQGPVLRLGVLLGGLMGLRQREVIFLTWKNVDLKSATLIIQEEVGHIPKNTYSVRRLPIPKIVLKEIKSLSHREGRLVQTEKMKKFHRCKKENFAYDLAHYYSLNLNASLKEWRPSIRLSGKDLRNTLQTHALEAPNTWNKTLVDRYCGHAPTTMMERHYFGDRRDRLVKLFRDNVVPRIDQEVQKHLLGQNQVQKSNKKQNSEVATSEKSLQVIDFNELTG